MIHDIVPRGEMLRLEVSLRRGVPQAQPRDYRGAPYNMTQGRALQLELRDERHDGARDEGSRHTHLVEEVSRVPEQS